jgi:hypothetical protein
MTIEEQRSELKNQIAYYQQELAQLRELSAISLFGFMQDSENLVSRAFITCAEPQ